MPVVFLSYRRDDTSGEAGHLEDDLKRALGRRWVVFRDADGIVPGERFDAVLADELQRAKVVLVLIGRNWLPQLQQRLTQPARDYVRVEVAAALSKRKRVIPLMFRGATLPNAMDLPDDLAKLPTCQWLEFRAETWKTDLDRLINAIGPPYPWRYLALRAALVMATTLVAALTLFPQLPVDRWRWLMTLILGLYGLTEAALAGYRAYRRRVREAQYS